MIAAAPSPAARSALSIARPRSPGTASSSPPDVWGSKSRSSDARRAASGSTSMARRARAFSGCAVLRMPRPSSATAPGRAEIAARSKHGGAFARAQHRAQVPGQPEAGDVGGGRRPPRDHRPRGRPIGAEHRGRGPPPPTHRARGRACRPAGSRRCRGALVRTSWSPGAAPPMRISASAEAAKPQTAKPTTSSGPVWVCPPTSVTPSATRLGVCAGHHLVVASPPHAPARPPARPPGPKRSAAPRPWPRDR